MATIKKSELLEIGLLNDGDYFDIVTKDNLNRKIKFSTIKSAISKSVNSYVDVKSKDGTIYRLTVNNKGELVVQNAEAFTGTAPEKSESGRFAGLMINMIYGGGNNQNNTACSHHFIELYNQSVSNIDLNLKGLYISVKSNTGSWQSLALEGIIPYQHSFLIRCRQVSNPVLLGTRCKIDYYDQEWDIDLPDVGFSAYLSIGTPTTENPFNSDGNLNKEAGYIDILGAGGINEDEGVKAFEERYPMLMTKDIGARRLDFYDTDNNQKDCRAINWKTCDVKMYRPRCVKDGKWDLYFNKAKLKETIPNLINICYGKDGETTRTFTWQSALTDEGYIKWRKRGEIQWNKRPSVKEIVTHYDTDVTLHRAIIRDLEPGVYEYQCGEEGMWSDIETFEVRRYAQTADKANYVHNSIKMLWTTDQQSFTAEEMFATGVCFNNISEWEKNTDFDFHLNTGDISQNANRSFEWRYYFKYSNEFTRNMCHQITCGNNDLVDKKYSDAFTWYMTAEDYFLPDKVDNGSGTMIANPNKSTYNSCHSYDLGFVHFVCLNSNKDYAMFDENKNETIDMWIQKECAWLDADLTKDEANNKTRWVICYMHLSPFTCVRSDWVQRFVPIFEKHRVHMVLCGHNHTNSRSIAIRSGYDGTPNKTKYDPKGQKTAQEETALGAGTINHNEDLNNGTVYLMINATGFKNKGKEGIQNPYPWWYGLRATHPTQPTYATLEIGWDKITYNCYQIMNVLGKDKNGQTIVIPYGTQTKKLYDTYTLNWRPKGQTII